MRLSRFRLQQQFILAVGLLLFAGVFSSAAVKTIVSRNNLQRANPQFRFDALSVPSIDDAAGHAQFTIIDGTPDPNSGGLETLNDGLLPGSSDDPASNFFFAEGTDGGRIRVDLHDAIEIREVNTYSWHKSTRAAQVYKLYVSEGTGQDFQAAPKKGIDPEKCGWKLVAAVDTRPTAEPIGGQYGVNIGDTTGSIGHERYLLFDISATELNDPFGNTFYSEIDVVDKDELLHPLAPVGAGAHDQIIINTDEVPEMKAWADHLRPIVEKWYPILVKDLPSEGFTAPKRFSITFRRDKRGVADTSGTRVNCAANWFKGHPDDEGAVVHEMVHVVQQYPSRRGNPGWLTEGIADYYRWFVYEPAQKRPHTDPSSSNYTDGYQVTAAFLDYIVRTKDDTFTVKMNAAMRQGKYQPELWKKWAGKNLDELWDEYIATLR